MPWKGPAPIKPENKIRIVIADDHVVLLESLTMLLQSQPDFEVVGKAVNGTQAVDLVNQQRPNVLVLDLFMPEGDGFDVLRTLERAGTQVAAVVLTASESQPDYVQVVKLGARGLVLKADDPQKLFDAIRTVAAGDLAFSSDIANQVVSAMATEPRSEPTSLARLSDRERQIAFLVARGLKNKDIAAELDISENTVKRHLQSIFSKTGTRDRLELAVLAVTELSRAA
jgi:two-component system, NarL family, response regulator YdfI